MRTGRPCLQGCLVGVILLPVLWLVWAGARGEQKGGVALLVFLVGPCTSCIVMHDRWGPCLCVYRVLMGFDAPRLKPSRYRKYHEHFLALTHRHMSHVHIECWQAPHGRCAHDRPGLAEGAGCAHALRCVLLRQHGPASPGGEWVGMSTRARTHVHPHACAHAHAHEHTLTHMYMGACTRSYTCSHACEHTYP